MEGSDDSLTNILLASDISESIIDAALETGLYDDALTTISQIDLHDIDMKRLANLSMDFVIALGKQLEKR